MPDKPAVHVQGTIPFTNLDATVNDFLQLAQEALNMRGITADSYIERLIFEHGEGGHWTCKVEAYR